MRGIAEERLQELIKGKCDYSIEDLTKYECTELNPWLPIKSAPKDRRILLFYPKHTSTVEDKQIISSSKAVAQYTDEFIKFYITKPTHWQELPPDPE